MGVFSSLVTVIGNLSRVFVIEMVRSTQGIHVRGTLSFLKVNACDIVKLYRNVMNRRLVVNNDFILHSLLGKLTILLTLITRP